MNSSKTPLEYAKKLLLEKKETTTWSGLKDLTGLSVNAMRAILDGERAPFESTIYRIIASLDKPVTAWELAREHSPTMLRRLAEYLSDFAGNRDLCLPGSDYFDTNVHHILMYACSGNGLTRSDYLTRFPSAGSVVENLEERGVLKEVDGKLVAPFFDLSTFAASLKTSRSRADALLQLEQGRIAGEALDLLEEITPEAFTEVRSIIVEAIMKAVKTASMGRSSNGVKFSMAMHLAAFGLDEKQKKQLDASFRKEVSN